MAEREVSYAEILEILHLVESSSEFAEFHLKFGELEIDLRKTSAVAGGLATSVRPVAVEAVRSAIEPVPAPPVAASTATPAAQAVEAGMAVVRSPMVGTYYCAPEPGAEPFVQAGQRVQADTVVCIIEVMKLMNSITAGQAGIVTRILAKDTQAVEFGEPLIVIDPQS